MGRRFRAILHKRSKIRPRTLHERSGSSEKVRSRATLESGSPGTMASLSTAASRSAPRKPALRSAESALWQPKQVSTRIGWMCRLNEMLAPPTGAEASASVLAMTPCTTAKAYKTPMMATDGQQRDCTAPSSHERLSREMERPTGDQLAESVMQLDSYYNRHAIAASLSPVLAVASGPGDGDYVF